MRQANFNGAATASKEGSDRHRVSRRYRRKADAKAILPRADIKARAIHCAVHPHTHTHRTRGWRELRELSSHRLSGAYPSSRPKSAGDTATPTEKKSVAKEERIERANPVSIRTAGVLELRHVQKLRPRRFRILRAADALGGFVREKETSRPRRDGRRGLAVMRSAVTSSDNHGCIPSVSAV